MEDYTLSSLIKRVKSRLRDEEYPEDDIRAFLNEAQMEVLGEDRYPFLERVDDYTAMEGGEMDLPLDYQSTFNIFVKRGEGARQLLEYLPYNQFFTNHGFGRAFTYTSFGNKIFFALPPIRDDDDAEYDDEDVYEIQHLYLARPIPMQEDDDPPIIPPEYSEILVLGALARAERTRENFDFAQDYQNQQGLMITDMKARFGIRQQGGQSRARTPFRRGAGAFYGGF